MQHARALLATRYALLTNGRACGVSSHFNALRAFASDASQQGRGLAKSREKPTAVKKVGDALPQTPRRRPPPAARRSTDAPASYIHGMLRECLTPQDVLRVWGEESASADAIAHAAALQRLSFLQGGVAPHKRKPLPLHTMTERLHDLQRTMVAEIAAPVKADGEEEHPALRPRTLSSVAHAVGKMGLAAPQLMEHIAAASVGRMRRFNSTDINQLLHGTSMTGTASDALLIAAASRLRRLRSEVSTAEAAGIASSTAAICRGRGSALAGRDEKGVLALFRFVRGEATPEPLDVAEAAHIALSISGGRLLKSVQGASGLPPNHLQAAMKKAELSPQALSNFVHALAKSGLPHLALASKRKATEVAGTGPLAVVSSVDVLGRMAPLLIATMRSQSKIGLACIANAYKQLGVVDLGVWGELTRCAQHPQRLGSATPHQIATLTTAIAWAQGAATKGVSSPSEIAEIERRLNTHEVFRSACKGMLRHLEPPSSDGLVSSKRTYAPPPCIPPQPRDLVELRSACIAVGHRDTQLAALATRAMLPQLRVTPPHLAARFVQDLASEDVRPNHAAEALQHVAHFASVAAALAKRSKPPQIGQLLQVAACGTPPAPAGPMALASRWLRQQVGQHAAMWAGATPFQLAQAVQSGDEEAVKVALAAMQVAHDEDEPLAPGGSAQVMTGQPNHPRNAAAGVTPQMFLHRVLLPILRHTYSAAGQVAPLEAALPAVSTDLPRHTGVAAPASAATGAPVSDTASTAARSGSIGGYLDAFAGAGEETPPPAPPSQAPITHGRRSDFKFRTSEWSLPDLVLTMGTAATVTDLPPAEATGAFGQLAHRVLSLPPKTRDVAGAYSVEGTASKRMAQLTAVQAACAAAAAARLGQLALAGSATTAAATHAQSCMHIIVEAAALRVARAEGPPNERFHTLAIAAWAAALADCPVPEVNAALQHELLLAERSSPSAVGLAPNTAALLAHVDEMGGGELLASMPRPIVQLLAAARRKYGKYGDWAKPTSWKKLQGKCEA